MKDGKLEITERIAYFLDIGKILAASKEKATVISAICEDFYCHKAASNLHLFITLISAAFSINALYMR